MTVEQISNNIAGMFVSIIFFSIPLVVILTKHQQKMAQILRGQMQEDKNGSLQKQVDDLTYLVHSQSLSIDNLTQAVIRNDQKSQDELAGRLANRS